MRLSLPVRWVFSVTFFQGTLPLSPLTVLLGVLRMPSSFSPSSRYVLFPVAVKSLKNPLFSSCVLLISTGHFSIKAFGEIFPVGFFSEESLGLRSCLKMLFIRPPPPGAVETFLRGYRPCSMFPRPFPPCCLRSPGPSRGRSWVFLPPSQRFFAYVADFFLSQRLDRTSFFLWHIIPRRQPGFFPSAQSAWLPVASHHSRPSLLPVPLPTVPYGDGPESTFSRHNRILRSAFPPL